MTLPASGAISFNAINVELGVAGTTQASLGQTSYRNLAGVASGQISMSNFYGKANQFAFTISSNQTNANLRTLAVNAGWNQSSKVVATIASGVYVSANSTGTPALTVNGSFPGGVALVNNGFIVGMGGAGGGGANAGDAYVTSGSSGASGGPALSVQSAISINNAGTIAGGGGGGGAGRCSSYYYSFCPPGYFNYGGGGGGGGRSGATNSAGGAAGVATGSYVYWSGLAGNVGTSSAAGVGGLGGYERSGSPAGYGRGGSGGGWGSAGATGNAAYLGGSYAGPTAGGSGGNCTTAGSNANITWVATGTRLGTIG